MNKKTSLWWWVLLGIVVIALGFIITYRPTPSVTQPAGSASSTVSTATTTATTATSTATSSVMYTNTDYGFTFSLPADWAGFSIVQKEWDGTGQGGIIATGTTILIRNPRWTATDHYEDIPVLVFTTAQWNSYQAQDFFVSAAPFPASEMGSNNKYVFALPPRWDYDYSTGYQEADSIVASMPLHPFSL